MTNEDRICKACNQPFLEEDKADGRGHGRRYCTRRECILERQKALTRRKQKHFDEHPELYVEGTRRLKNPTRKRRGTTPHTELTGTVAVEKILATAKRELDAQAENITQFGVTKALTFIKESIREVDTRAYAQFNAGDFALSAQSVSMVHAYIVLHKAMAHELQVSTGPIPAPFYEWARRTRCRLQIDENIPGRLKGLFEMFLEGSDETQPPARVASPVTEDSMVAFSD